MKNRHFLRAGFALVLAAGLALGPQQVAASPVIDPAGDFLATFGGPANGYFDVLSTEVVYDVGADTFSVSATFNGVIDLTTGTGTATLADDLLYVWGFNRGGGSELFRAPPVVIGTGVFFDSVFVADPGLNLGLVVVDLAAGIPSELLPGALTISGNSLSAVFDAAFLPSTGFAPSAFTFNLWPRLGLGPDTQISDFAPDEGTVPGVSTNAAVTVVPEPASLALMSLGLIALLWFRRGAGGRS